MWSLTVVILHEGGGLSYTDRGWLGEARWPAEGL